MIDRPVLETVAFRLLPGADADAFRAADDAAQAFLEAWPGYLGRTLAVEPDGTYHDLVRWVDRATALAAAEAYLASDAGRAMAVLIDPGSIRMRHLEIERDAMAMAV